MDVKGDGDGYILLPPSIHPSGAAYEWDESVGVTAPEFCPDWVVEKLLKGDRAQEDGDELRPFTRAFHCPVCLGHRDLPHGQGIRCYGFLSSDRAYAHCTREDRAGRLKIERIGTFAHRLGGSCDCGARHEAGAPVPSVECQEAAAPDPESVPRGFRRPAEVLAAIPKPKFRFEVPGLPSLMKATRDGFPTGIVVVIVGWPDAGKTGLGTQIVVSIAINYEAVVVLFTPDGGQEATAIRVGGLLGLDQDKLEGRNPEERAKLEEKLRAHRLFIVDDTEDGMVFERVRAGAEKIRADLPHIYLVDSAQECLATEDADEMDERHRVIALMRAVYRTSEANQIPSLVFVTSQATGAAFTPPKKGDRTPAIGSPAESKKISYLSHLVIALEGDPGREPSFGRAAVVKSKLRGPKPSFGLRVDPATSRLEEIDAVVVEQAEQDRRARSRESRVEKIAAQIESLLLKSGPLLVEEIRERITGDKADIRDALNGLEAQGAAKWESAGKTGRGRRWGLIERGKGAGS